MAYLPESEQDRLRRQQEQGDQGPQVASGPSGVITGGTQQPAGQQADKGPSRSGAFTNLNAYLNANKEQSAQMSSNVAGSVGNRAEDAKGQLGQVDNDFRSAVDQGSVARDQDFVNKAVSDPTNFIKDQNNVQKFAGIRDATFKGPQTLQDQQNYGNAQQAIKNANQAVENTKSEAGRFSLLQDQYKAPSYNHGQQRLDQLLLQNDPTARDQFQQVQNKYSGLMDQLNQAQTNAQAYAAQKKADTEAAAKDAKTALGMVDDPTTPVNEAAGAFGNFQSDLKNRTQQYKNDQQAKYKRLMQQLGAGQNSINPGGTTDMDADVMAMLGLQNGQHLYDLNLSQLAPTFNANAINEQNVATKADYDKYAALSQLAGVDPTYLVDAKNAGTAPGIQVDKDLIQQKLANAQKRYNDIASQAEGFRGGFNTLRDYWNDPTFGDYSNAQQLADFVNNRMANDSTWQWYSTGANGGDYPMIVKQITDWANQYNALNPNRVVTKKG